MQGIVKEKNWQKNAFPSKWGVRLVQFKYTFKKKAQTQNHYHFHKFALWCVDCCCPCCCCCFCWCGLLVVACCLLLVVCCLLLVAWLLANMCFQVNGVSDWYNSNILEKGRRQQTSKTGRITSWPFHMLIVALLVVGAWPGQTKTCIWYVCLACAWARSPSHTNTCIYVGLVLGPHQGLCSIYVWLVMRQVPVKEKKLWKKCFSK